MEHIQVGPVGPVPPILINEFTARSLREQPTKDTVNAREYLRWNADLPVPSTSHPRNGERPVFFDMAPMGSRNQNREQFLQAQPFVVEAPPFQGNPYFSKYDITSDPRNAIRELRGAVIENITNKGVDESIRLFSRGFDNQSVPVDEMGKIREKGLDDWNSMRPGLDNMEKNWRKITALTKIT